MTEQLIGRRVLRYEQVKSTNTLAHALAEHGEAEGLVITADEQSAGRGRLGRKWIVPRGTSLQFSILLRPALLPQHATRLTPMAGLAVARTLEQELKLQPTLKWPNDVHLNGKKVAGILTESSFQDNTLEFVILGIGLNVNYTMSAYPELAPHATTLQDVIGHEVERDKLERALLAELDRYYARICRGESLLQEYRGRLAMLGQPIRVETRDKILKGIAEDVDEDGALILQQDGARIRLLAGDVTILKQDKEAV